MATSSWQNATNVGSVYAQVRNLADGVSRTNNTITINNYRVQVRSSSSSFYDTGLRLHGQLPNGTNRFDDNIADGTITTSPVSSASHDFSFSVSASATSTTWQAAFEDYTGTYWAPAQTLDIPNAGSPSLGTPSVTKLSPTSVKFTGTVNSWGAYCTAGDGVRFGYSTTTGGAQNYTSRTTSASPSATVTVTSNASLFVDMDATNGAGLSTDGPNNNYISNPEAPVMGTPVLEAVSATIPTTIDTGAGYYAITKQYQIKKTADTTWGAWTTYTSNDINATGLLPSTSYDVQVRSTTPAGTTTGSKTTFTTLPAAKLILSDGTVKNAVPHVITSDGTVTMVKVNQIT